MKKLLAFITVSAGSAALFAQEAAESAGVGIGDGLKFVGAGLAVGIACLGAGIAVGPVGAAAIGAMSENPEMSGKALPYVGLAEGICLWGFLVAILIMVL